MAAALVRFGSPLLSRSDETRLPSAAAVEAAKEGRAEEEEEDEEWSVLRERHLGMG